MDYFDSLTPPAPQTQPLTPPASIRCIGEKIEDMISDAPRPDDDVRALRREIAKYPTDLQLRFKLGVALSALRERRAAIPELHAAINSPFVRVAALRLLIQAYEAEGKTEVAALLRETLSRESGDDAGSGSAPVPAPVRPTGPRGSSRAAKSPEED